MSKWRSRISTFSQGDMQPFYTLVLQYYQHALGPTTHTTDDLVSLLNELNNAEMPVKNVSDQVNKTTSQQ